MPPRVVLRSFELEVQELSHEWELIKKLLRKHGFYGNQIRACRYFLCGTHLTVAYVNEKPAGVFSWFLKPNTIYTQGTWVAPEFRRQKIAALMWDDAIRFSKCSRIDCGTITFAGAIFALRQKKRLGEQGVRVTHHALDTYSYNKLRDIRLRKRWKV